MYRACDRWTEKEVALKVLTANAENPSLLQDFKKEFLLLTQLKHPGVVEALDFGYTEDISQPGKSSPYFTMEFIEGKNLGEAFSDLSDLHQTSVEFERLYHIIWQICDILEFLHLRDIVHCDLKPDNLKVTNSIFGLKILDFGLAEKTGSKRGRRTKGTLPYMAPEMFKELSLDGRTDLYSLGIILYEIVTSRLPFDSDEPVKIVSAQLQQKPRPPSELNPQIPPSLNSLIMKLLEKSPADRPNDATWVKEMVETELCPDLKKARKHDFSQKKGHLAHLHSGPMVGREKEFVQLEEELKMAISSQGVCLFLSGEQGAGKSSLFRELKIKSQLQGITFVDSNCLENQTLAYQPLMEIFHKLEPYIESKCPHQKLTRFKTLLQLLKGESSIFPEDQVLFHQNISDILVEVSQFFSFVIAVENLQWSDLPTLQFLKHFKTQKDKGKILLCCSLREKTLKQDSPIETWINRCLNGEDVRHLRLDRFDLTRTKDLISSKFITQRFPSKFFAYVHQRTSGNPFFVIEALEYMIEKGIIFLRDSTWSIDLEKLKESDIHDSIEAVLLKNLQRYDEKTIDLLNIMAVIGKKFSFQLLPELNLLDGKELEENLLLLTQDQLLIKREESVGSKMEYEFANQSLQTLLYRRLDQAKRISWHKRVGELLEKKSSEGEDESIFEITHHYLEGEEFEKAYHYALLSAEKMKGRFANDQVLRYLEKAIEVTSKLSDRNQVIKKQVEALIKRADFCKTVGDLNQAEEDYLNILKLTKSSSDLKLLAKTYNDLGETYRLKHDYKKGIFYLKKAMKIHQKLDDPHQLADTLSYMGLLYWIDSQYEEALDSFNQALKIDRKLGNKSPMASNLNNMGLVFWSTHQYAQALENFTDSLILYRELGNKEWIARSLNNIGATFLYLGEYPQAIDHLFQSLKLNEEIGNEKENALNFENLGETFQKMGDYENAIKYNEMGLGLARRISLNQRVGYMQRNMGLIHFELGNYEKAFRFMKEAQKTAEKIEDKELQVSIWVGLSKFYLFLNGAPKAELLLSQAIRITNTIKDERSLINVYLIKSRLKREGGQFEEAIKLLDDSFTLAKKLNVGEEIFSLTLEYAELYLDRGNIERVATFLGQAKDSGLERYKLLLPKYYLLCGREKFVRGNSKSAQRDFETAVRLAQKLNHLEILWQIHHQLGKLSLYTRDTEKAYQELKTAGGILKKLSESIEDKDLKRNYLEDTRKKELLSNLRLVAKDLIGETKTK